jgi:hypothetical protein
MSLEATFSERFHVAVTLYLDLYLGECLVRMSTGTSANLTQDHRGFTQSLEVNVRDITSICPIPLSFETVTNSLRRSTATESVADNL